MTELDTHIKKAFENPDDPKSAASVYNTFFKSELFLPCKKLTAEEQQSLYDDEQRFIPLYSEHEGNYYLLVFDTLKRLDEWAGELRSGIDYASIQGSDLVVGLGEKVFVCLNFGTDYYKEFSPQEVAKLKGILIKESKDHV
jgi:hypothetical protein